MLGKEALAHNFKVTSRYFADRKIRKKKKERERGVLAKNKQLFAFSVLT